MAKVKLRNEILFKAPTRVGLLADVAEALSAGGVNIEAIGAYDKAGSGELLLLTSDNRTAAEVLEPFGGELDLVPVIVVEVENSPGALARVARRIADAGLNIEQIHATTTDAPAAMLVMRTVDEATVINLLSDL